MARPKVDEVLFVYIAVAFHIVSLVLIRVDNGAEASSLGEQVLA